MCGIPVEHTKRIGRGQKLIDPQPLRYRIPPPEAEEDAEANDCGENDKLVERKRAGGSIVGEPEARRLGRSVARGCRFGPGSEEPREICHGGQVGERLKVISIASRIAIKVGTNDRAQCKKGREAVSEYYRKLRHRDLSRTSPEIFGLDQKW
jgi:hypothetical protein